MFHSRTGTLVRLSNGNRTAYRNNPDQEFNNGIVISSQSLQDNQLFEVRIDQKVESWTGSIEIGVTTCNPNTLEFPPRAVDFREKAWIMLGSSVFCDGRFINEDYGFNLDTLSEGERVGVMRTYQGDLQFFINGINQGIAATSIPFPVYAVIDMYGKCTQVTIMETNPEAEMSEVTISNDMTLVSDPSMMGNNVSIDEDKLRFHDRCGTLVKLSNNNRTAERKRPLDEFNNGVVMTHRPLKDNELFEIRIDRMIDKWSGSIELGVTSHNPATLDFPNTMTNMRTASQGLGDTLGSEEILDLPMLSSVQSIQGTIMMSGCGILTNGKGTRREYGEYNLDELVEGDKIGLMKKSNGNLHYYINSMDQGIAATKVQSVYGVVDLYGRTVKVTIVDRDEHFEDSTNQTSNTLPQDFNIIHPNATNGDEVDNDCLADKLLFHPRCGYRASVKSNGQTAFRTNATDNFNNAVVLTNRTLRGSELFEVVLDRVIIKWAGSIEIGVTTHCPLELDFPTTMTNVRSGTWMMTGSGVMHNGTTICNEYGQCLDQLKIGDRVGVRRKDNGFLHFYVNGIDQGPAAASIPEKVYGVIDLYGQAAQATIVDQLELSGMTASNSSGSYVNDMRFHHLHGRNIQISNGGLTASRPNAYNEFNESIVMSSRPLLDGELFEVTIDKVVNRWCGSIEIGVTAISPENLEFPETMTDINYDTWMLSGTSIMQDGATIKNGYKCDLDFLGTDARVGMSRHTDGTLHFYLDGEDQGPACSDIPPNVYAVIDLYGQCSQVSIIPSSQQFLNTSLSTLQERESTRPVYPVGEPHRFSHCCGKHVVMRHNYCTASRVNEFDHGLIFSSVPLKTDDVFEIRVDRLCPRWSGGLQIGLTSLAVSNTYPEGMLPSRAIELSGCDSWLVTCSQVRKNNVVLKNNYCPSLQRVQIGDKIGIKRAVDGSMHIFINGEDLGPACHQLPKKVHVVIDLYGLVDTVTVLTRGLSVPARSDRLSSQEQRFSFLSSESHDSLECDREIHSKERIHYEFHENYGRNIQLSNSNMTARRTASYNQGIVVSHKPLARDQLFEVRIDRVNPVWTSSLLIGVIGQSADKMCFPVTILGIKKSAWIICNDCVFENGTKVKGHYGPNLDGVQVRHVLGVLVDSDNRLHLYVNGIDQGIAAKDIPQQCYAVVDLYGQCEEVTVVNGGLHNVENTNKLNYREKADIDNGKKEKIYHVPGAEQSIVCDYKMMCSRFKASLGLPDGYFLPDGLVCYCETCYKVRGDNAYSEKGDPPKQYAIPFGWCRYLLRIPIKAEQAGVLEKWHVAYHGAQLEEIRRILDRGELLLPGESCLETNLRNVLQKNKDEDEDTGQIFFSPTIRYAGHNMFSGQNDFVDPKTKAQACARVAFQILVRPGSYKIGPQRIGMREPVDHHFNNSELEWFTKERDATVLHSLLIRIEDF